MNHGKDIGCIFQCQRRDRNAAELIARTAGADLYEICRQSHILQRISTGGTKTPAVPGKCGIRAPVLLWQTIR